MKYDGIDASQVLMGLEQPIRKKSIMWQRPPGVSSQGFPDLAVREGDNKLMTDIDGSNTELYHIASDEGETTNLADKLPKLTRVLKKKVLRWYSTMSPLIK